MPSLPGWSLRRRCQLQTCSDLMKYPWILQCVVLWSCTVFSNIIIQSIDASSICSSRSYNVSISIHLKPIYPCRAINGKNSTIFPSYRVHSLSYLIVLEVVPLEWLASLSHHWRHLHWLQICSPGGTLPTPTVRMLMAMPFIKYLTL